MSYTAQINSILEKHVGKRNAITSAEIANIIGIIEDDTHAQTRALIFETAEIYSLPLAADTRGYYLIASEEEYEAYMNNLDNRKAGIDKRKDIITKNWRK